MIMQQLTLTELEEWKRMGKDFYLVDVRDDDEREAFHIGGEALPLPDLPDWADELPSGLPIVVYCKRGIRSQIAIQRLQRKSHLAGSLYNLQGGIYELLKARGLV